MNNMKAHLRDMVAEHKPTGKSAKMLNDFIAGKGNLNEILANQNELFRAFGATTGKVKKFHKDDGKPMLLEITEETKDMSSAQLKTLEVASITEALKEGFHGFDTSLSTHAKQLRDVPLGKVLSKSELDAHRKDIISLVQKADLEMQLGFQETTHRFKSARQSTLLRTSTRHKITAKKSSQRIRNGGLVPKHFMPYMWGIMDGFMGGKLIWNAYNGDKSERCEILSKESLEPDKCRDDKTLSEKECPDSALEEAFEKAIESTAAILSKKGEAMEDSKALSEKKWEDASSLVEEKSLTTVHHNSGHMAKVKWGSVVQFFNDNVIEPAVQVYQAVETTVINHVIPFVEEHVVKPAADAVEKAHKLFHGTVEWVSKLPAKAKKALESVGNALVSAGGAIIDGAGDILKKGWELLKEGWEWVKETLGGWVKKIQEFFESWTDFLRKFGDELLSYVELRDGGGTCQLVDTLIDAVPLLITAVLLKVATFLASQVVPIVGQIVAALKVVMMIITALFSAEEYIATGKVIEAYENHLTDQSCGCVYFGETPSCETCEKGIDFNNGARIGLIGVIATNANLAVKGARKIAARTKRLTTAIKRDGLWKGLKSQFGKTYRQYKAGGGKYTPKKWVASKVIARDFAGPKWPRIRVERMFKWLEDTKGWWVIEHVVHPTHMLLTGNEFGEEAKKQEKSKMNRFLEKFEKLTEEQQEALHKELIKAFEEHEAQEELKANDVNVVDLSETHEHNNEATQDDAEKDNAGKYCQPRCPSATTLHECFQSDYKFYQKKISSWYKFKNDKSAQSNAALLKIWQQCPSVPVSNVPCKGVSGKCIDVRYSKCTGSLIQQNRCPGTKNVQCCSTYMFDTGEEVEEVEEVYEVNRAKSQ